MADWLLRFDAETGRNGEKGYQILKEASEQNRQIYSIPLTADDIDRHHFRDAKIGDIVYFWIGGKPLRAQKRNGIYDKAMLTEIDPKKLIYTFNSTDIKYRQGVFSGLISPLSSAELRAKVKRKENLLSPDEKDYIEGQLTSASMSIDITENSQADIRRALENLNRSMTGFNTALPQSLLDNLGALKSIEKITQPLIELSKTYEQLNPINVLPPAAQLIAHTHLPNSSSSVPEPPKPKKNRRGVSLTGILSSVLATVDRNVSSDRRQTEKGYQINKGVRVLRGFAPYNDLKDLHETDLEYQRDIKNEHIASLIKFMDSENNFISEIVYAFRAENEDLYLEQVEGSGTDTQKGIIQNLDIYRFTPPDGAKLYCIDGNHRFQATKAMANMGEQRRELLIPFCIIFVTDKEDAEEFIFNEPSYFFNLNGRSEPLLYEQTFKYLADRLRDKKGIEKQLSCYKFFEILNTVGSIPVFNDKIGSDDSKLGELLFQVYKKYEDKIEGDGKIVRAITTTLEKICKDKNIRGRYILNNCPDILPALCLYLYYESSEDTTNIKDDVHKRCSWLELRKFRSEHFDTIEKMELQFEQYMNIKTINIFMAMPFEPAQKVDNMNRWKNEELLPRLKEKFDNCEVTFPEIMREQKEAREMWDDIRNKIDTADIVICDITGCNINVIYEMGIAYGSKKKLIVIRENKDKVSVPFDMYQLHHTGYDDMEHREFKNKLNKKIDGIIKDQIEAQ